MPRDFSQIGTYLLVALFVFAVYRRLRRTFGRQPLRPRRMMVRIVLFAALLSPTLLRSSAFAGAAAAGIVAGILLALWGASRTRFERAGAQLFYVPHTYTGIAVSLLFIGRVAYRLLQAYGATHGMRAAPAAAGAESGVATYVSSPLTLGLFFVLAGYYVCYLGLISWKSKHLKAGEAVEIPSPLGAAAGRAAAGRADVGTPS
jgi:hypothetical protein